MALAQLTIQDLWETAGFRPNEEQEQAIRWINGPLYLPAGPGSGKTRVLLWRTLNLIVVHDVPPEAIYLSTFTEKAALQLLEGLQVLLGHVTNLTGRPFDLAQMYVGTVHSVCQRILSDRRFSPDRQRARPPYLLDELGQYFHLARRRNWEALIQSIGLNGDDDNVTIYRAFYPDYSWDSTSRHNAVTVCRDFFNRVAEECIDPTRALELVHAADPQVDAYLIQHHLDPDDLDLIFSLYHHYRQSLVDRPVVPLTDFALLQQAALNALERIAGSGHVFQHIIVDEYQDTYTIQERIFFRLASGHSNICAVGDDDLLVKAESDEHPVCRHKNPDGGAMTLGCQYAWRDEPAEDVRGVRSTPAQRALTSPGGADLDADCGGKIDVSKKGL
jgi:DNA helicase-2/ATP-dependent DNA helicase PcrA